jgi:hypothetical protein
MPRVNVDGEWINIPFDAEKMVALMLEGYEVWPDEGVDPGELLKQQKAIAETYQLYPSETIEELFASQRTVS